MLSRLSSSLILLRYSPLRQSLVALVSGDVLPRGRWRSASTHLQSEDVVPRPGTEEDAGDCLDANSFLLCPANPTWFEATPVLSEAEHTVSVNWNEEKSSSRKRAEETEIAKLFLSADIVSCLEKRGITTLFPIQRAVLTPALQGHDMICRAKTGTGKTLAYGIPIMEKIIRFKASPVAKRRYGRDPLALIMTPTRELAKQVQKELRESSSLKIVSVHGGQPIAHQLNELNYGVDILVGTPGRINDLLSKNILNLSQVQMAVLDESDQMLSISFHGIVDNILGKIPPLSQSIMFSSTLPDWMKQFQDVYLKNPLVVDLVGDSAEKLPERITLFSVESDGFDKPLLIKYLILVIHYDVPVTSEAFLHRSGRTGRAGKKGKVVLIYTDVQIEDVKKIEQDVGCKFEDLPVMKTGTRQSRFVDPDLFDGIRRLGFSQFERPKEKICRQGRQVTISASQLPIGFGSMHSGPSGVVDTLVSHERWTVHQSNWFNASSKISLQKMNAVLQCIRDKGDLNCGSAGSNGYRSGFGSISSHSQDDDANTLHNS